jgi:hypothetical protein
MTSQHKFPCRGICAPWILAVGVLFLCSSAARAEHAAIDLLVSQSDKQAEAHADEEPPLGGLYETPVFNMKAGEPAVMQFIFVNIYPHRELPQATVRYYVIPIRELGQKETPSPDDGQAVVLGQVIMPFKPKCRVGARLQFTVPEPGLYRMRVDTLNTQSDHEHFSAIDLVVQ